MSNSHPNACSQDNTCSRKNAQKNADPEIRIKSMEGTKEEMQNAFSGDELVV